MSSCGIMKRVCHKSINRLEKDTVSFYSLPIEVKDFFDTVSRIKTPAEMDEFFYNSQNVPLTEKSLKYCNPFVLVFNSTYEYELKTIYVFKEFWISHFLLVDKTNNITYRFNYAGFTRLIIIFDREIFIPPTLNTFLLKKDVLETLTFDRYSIESDKKYQRIWKKAP